MQKFVLCLNTYTQSINIIAFPLQQLLYERASLLRYAYIALLVLFVMWQQLNTSS
jgi:hypothetical protein